MNFTPEELEICLNVLQEVADDPAVLNEHERFKSLVAKIHREGKRGKRQIARVERAEADQVAARFTGVVQQQTGETTHSESESPRQEYYTPRPCYVCKQSFTQLHPFYHRLCPSCAELNWSKRQQRANLSGRVALLTGGRIKSGYHTALKLLRDGARVIVTTRFPQDAARRFAEEADFDQWRPRLELIGLDLRDLPELEKFAQRLTNTEPHLDILIHNAAQTVKRPLAFYEHLLEAERALVSRDSSPVLLEARAGYRQDLPGQEAYFPLAQFDREGQQLDLRPDNSWRLKLGEIGTLEVVEVFLVNVVAPFVLSSRLLSLLERSPFSRRFIVNVSAVEGQFSRSGRTIFHPHTNMAKAALNMLTRTSAADLASRGIYLNSVDPGWFSDENPTPRAEMLRDTQGFYLPLDSVDGASRIYDPIACGINNPNEPPSGQYLKDYLPMQW